MSILGHNLLLIILWLGSLVEFFNFKNLNDLIIRFLHYIYQQISISFIFLLTKASDVQICLKGNYLIFDLWFTWSDFMFSSIAMLQLKTSQLKQSWEIINLKLYELQPCPLVRSTHSVTLLSLGRINSPRAWGWSCPPCFAILINNCGKVRHHRHRQYDFLT